MDQLFRSQMLRSGTPDTFGTGSGSSDPTGGLGNSGFADLHDLNGNSGAGYSILDDVKQTVDRHYFKSGSPDLGNQQHCVGMPIGQDAKFGVCSTTDTFKSITSIDKDSPRYFGFSFGTSF